MAADGLETGIDRRRVADIEHIGAGRSARCGRCIAEDLAPGGLELSLVEVQQEGQGAGRAQALGDGQADA